MTDKICRDWSPEDMKLYPQYFDENSKEYKDFKERNARDWKSLSDAAEKRLEGKQQIVNDIWTVFNEGISTLRNRIHRLPGNDSSRHEQGISLLKSYLERSIGKMDMRGLL